MAHALARTPFGFGAARFALGLGEAANFPAAIKTRGRVVPEEGARLRHRHLQRRAPTSARSSPRWSCPGSPSAIGWQWAFILTGAFGFIWLVFWFWLYDAPEKQPAALARRSSPTSAATRPSPPATMPWLSLLGYRQTWAFALGKFMTDPIWWFYLYWIPKFLHEQHGITLSQDGAAADRHLPDRRRRQRSAGGWLSSCLIKRGWSLNARAQDGDAGDGAVRDADRVRVAGLERLGRGRSRRPGRGRAPGLVGQPVHDRLRHVPAAGRRARWSGSAAWPGPWAAC